jgi:hypothetical protein
MTAHVLWMNIPLMLLAFALSAGVPLWIALRHPDRHPRENRSLPAYLAARRPKRPAAIRARAYDGERGLVAL